MLPTRLEKKKKLLLTFYIYKLILLIQQTGIVG